MLRRTLCSFLIVFPLSLIAQQSKTTLPPQLVAADLPTYPPIARLAHITGWLKIRVTIEKGNIVKTAVLSTEARDNESHVFSHGVPVLTTPTLTNLKTWRFAPDSNGTFVVTYRYNIEGSETDAPTTPRIEILPSLDVNVTARPVKSTVNY
jgi:hypothetical protein